jgi:hypothetical protein
MFFSRQCAPDPRPPPRSIGRALRPKDSLDPVHDLRVVQQCASADVGSALLDSFEEFGILFQHAINGFLNESRSFLTRATGKVTKAAFPIC